MARKCPEAERATTSCCPSRAQDGYCSQPDKKCERNPETPQADVALNDLLVRLNSYIDDMRGKQYEYNERFDKTNNTVWEHKADLLDHFASELVEILKAY